MFQGCLVLYIHSLPIFIGNIVMVLSTVYTGKEKPLALWVWVLRLPRIGIVSRQSDHIPLSRREDGSANRSVRSVRTKKRQTVE
ncbi:hypothetical protein BDV23DRAFT_166253 [Aspergillus alliaceus]|uniref:Uncharacterized protein n=1 Tax=Petromyces alliaceus TaxID=209559 RepID=A0A5N7BSW6_PETAA|nr:hypothetical protein BDV23DRAFT_166253 [Aspergillus alliaceus]